jgi:hypothetical protein
MDLMNQHIPFRHKLIWKLKVALKINIFRCYLQKSVILTKETKNVASVIVMKQLNIFFIVTKLWQSGV